MSQTVLSLDFETFSKANLKKVGTGRYTRDPSSRVLLLGYAIDNEPVDVVRFSQGQQMPKRLKEALRDPDVIKSAWNAAFERQVFQNILGMPIPFEQWRCTMVMAYTLSFPGELSVVGRLLGVPEDKQKIAHGKKLIKRFCGPNKPTKKSPWAICDDLTHPAEWEEFVEYCARDVDSERFIRNKILKWDMPEHEWELYHLDQRINEAGIPINMNMVENAIRIADTTVSARLAEMRRITGLANPNSNVQLLGWLKEQGYKFDDLKKGHVQTAINRLYEACQDDPGALEYHRDLIRVLEMRQEVSKTSVKKYVALRDAVDDDGVLRNAFQFAGAQRTWRFAGRRWQPQNLARPTPRLEKVLEEVANHVERFDADTIELLHKYPMDVLSSCVRPAAQAQEGHIFVDADLNAIENRVLGWLANDQKILDVFRQGRDPYIDFATYMFKESYEVLFHEYKAEGKKERRTLSKPAVLGCGFMLSAGEERLNHKTGEMEGTGLIGYARNMGVNMTRDQAAHAVKVFRNTFTEVVKFWYNLERAAKACIRTGRPQRVGFIVFDMSGPFMRMKLPSGRNIHYFKPRVELKRKPWGDIGETITYEGLNDKNQWVRVPTHPGKLTENCLSGNTKVLTNTGIKRILEVTKDDLLWDGVTWVTHDGLVSKGIKRTISVEGVRMTPDHKVLVNEKWIEAERVEKDAATSSFERHYGAALRDACGGESLRLGRQGRVLDDALRLRNGEAHIGIRAPQGQTEVVRVRTDREHICRELDTSNDRPPSLCRLEIAESPMRESQASRVEELRRQGDNGLPGVGAQLRSVLGGHGPHIPCGADNRESGQQSGLLARELRVGDKETELPEYAGKKAHRHSEGENVYRGGRGDQRHRQDDTSLQSGARLSPGEDVRPPGCYEQVFDLVNAGPRHRFTVIGENGECFIVHNCVQAVARDLLGHAMLLCRKKKLGIRLHVHDQIVGMVKKENAELGLQILLESMKTVPQWAPGLILGAEGTIARVFMKD